MPNTIVIKYGGHAMDKVDQSKAFVQDLANLRSKNFDFVLVHGGGPAINTLLSRLGLQSHFIRGLRVTDKDTMQAVEMALSADVNKTIVAKLLAAGISAVGLSGRDGNTLQATIKDEALGLVGKVNHVNPKILKTLLAENYLPVLAPVANSSEFTPLNVNADEAAAAVAGALKADSFVLISDVPGVLDGQGKLQTHLNEAKIQTFIETQVIKDGMLPKVNACLEALTSGVQKALILDGRQPNALSRFLDKQEPLGTIITKS